MRYPHQRRTRGFSLLELAMVLAFAGLLFGGLASLLPQQLQRQRVLASQASLLSAHDALLGFVAIHGRLPCPATDTSHGQEAFCSNASGSCGSIVLPASGLPSHGRCAAFAISGQTAGFLPSATLGLGGKQHDGVSTDDWGGQAHRLRYAVTDRQLNPASADWAPEPLRSQLPFHPYTAPVDAVTGHSGLHDLLLHYGFASLDAINGSARGNLVVCHSASGISSSQCGPVLNELAGSALVVIYASGANSATGGNGADESANPNPNGGSNDRSFVWHPPQQAGAGNGEFDDLLIWMAGPELVHRLVLASQLP